MFTTFSLRLYGNKHYNIYIKWYIYFEFKIDIDINIF